MEKAGITMMLKKRAVAATHQGVELNDGRMLLGATVVCTIGTAISPIVQSLDVPKERGRIRTAPEMRIEGQTNAWAIGDCAYIINTFDNKPSPTTGQFAERQGRQAALNLIRVLNSEPTRPFRFKVLGQLCSIGGYQAVAEMLGVHVSGFLAWLMWRSVYLFKLPTWSRRVKVALDWSWDVLFPRDLSFLNTESAERFTHAYYRPGDFICRQGELARTFSAIEEGQVEVLHTDEESSEPKVIALLGKGDFFGEAALLGNRPHDASVRARTAVRLVQIGSALFSQIAGSFAPLREVLSQAVTRRSGDFWRRLPLAKSLLESESIASLMDPLPAAHLSKETTLADAVKALNNSATGELLVLDENRRLWATFDRYTLYHVVARIAITGEATHQDVTEQKLGDLLLGDPIYVALDDSTLVASATMLDHAVSWLPVVQSKDDLQPVGHLRGDRISRRLFEKIAQTSADHAKESTKGQSSPTLATVP
jgi:NADH dehydrogenase